jgi:hypothetical protein
MKTDLSPELVSIPATIAQLEPFPIGLEHHKIPSLATQLSARSRHIAASDLITKCRINIGNNIGLKHEKASCHSFAFIVK